MALEVKLAGTDEVSGAGTASKSVMNVLRGMLRTCYGYAKDVPEKVYLHCGLRDESTIVFTVLFECEGKFYTPQNIDKSKPEIEWNIDQERIMSLHKYLGNDLVSDILPLFESSGKIIPTTIQASYDIDKDKQTTVFSYEQDSDISKELWETEITSGDGFFINIADFEYLQIEEEF